MAEFTFDCDSLSEEADGWERTVCNEHSGKIQYCNDEKSPTICLEAHRIESHGRGVEVHGADRQWTVTGFIFDEGEVPSEFFMSEHFTEGDVGGFDDMVRAMDRDDIL